MDDTSLQIDNRQPPTVRVTVSPGRSVQTGNNFRIAEVVTAGVSKWIRAPVAEIKKIHFAEGEELDLPPDEARRLAKLGFVYFQDAVPGFTRPLGVTAQTAPPVERRSPDGPTAVQKDHDPDAMLGRPIGITQSEPRAGARQ